MWELIEKRQTACDQSLKKKKKTYPVPSIVCVAKFKTAAFWYEENTELSKCKLPCSFFPMKVRWGKADTPRCAASYQRAQDKKKSTVSANTHFIQPSLQHFPTMIRWQGKERGHVGGGLQVSRPDLEGIPSDESVQTNVPNQLCRFSVPGSCFYFCSVQTNNQLWSRVSNTLKQWHQKKKIYIALSFCRKA